MLDLKTILQKYPNCLSSRSVFKSVLLDEYPSEKRIVNILISIYECGIADRIKGKSQINQDDLNKYLTQLELDYGTPQLYSKQALEIWAKAYDVKWCENASVHMYSEHPEKSCIIYLLIDSGFHMTGGAIGALNSAIEHFLTIDLPSYQEALGYYRLKLQIIEYSSGARKVFDKPKALDEVIWDDLCASGGCDFGSAISLLEQELNVDYKNNRSTAPIIIAFSGTQCTDDYRNSILKIKKNHWFRSAIRIGAQIGSDSDNEALLAFTDNKESIIPSNQINIIKHLIRYDDLYYDFDDDE